MLIMHMQNKLYTIQFSHHPITDLQSVPEKQSQNPELEDFASFAKLPQKTTLLEKFELPDKRAFELTEMREARKVPASPWPTQSMTSMIWDIPLGQPGLAAWLRSLPAPAHLLVS